MYKSTLTLGTALLAFLGQRSVPQGPTLHLKEESMFVEYTATANEAVIKVKAESEISLEQVEMRSPDGSLLLTLTAQKSRALAISGFTFELLEADPLTVLSAYAEGTYDLNGRTVQGRSISGKASLSHLLPAAPVITYPNVGDLHVPASGFLVTWVPDQAVSGYRVILEQDDNDGLVVELPADAHSFRVPEGVLRARKRTMLEVAAIGANGNCTLVERTFRTE